MRNPAPAPEARSARRARSVIVSAMAPSAAGLVQLSDIHLRIDPRDGESGRRVERTVRAVLDLSVRPRAVLLSGDLVDEASPAACAAPASV